MREIFFAVLAPPAAPLSPRTEPGDLGAMFRSPALLALGLVALHGAAATKVTQQCDAMKLAQAIVGDGITIKSAEVLGNCGQFGTFTEGASVTKTSNEAGGSEAFISFGVTLSTGDVATGARVSNTKQNNGKSWDDGCKETGSKLVSDVSQICHDDKSCKKICDPAVLEFTFEVGTCLLSP